jgi:hypothetical protein
MNCDIEVEGLMIMEDTAQMLERPTLNQALANHMLGTIHC